MRSTEHNPITIEDLKHRINKKELIMGNREGIIGLKRELKRLKKEGRTRSYPIFVAHPDAEYWHLEWIKIE